MLFFLRCILTGDETWIHYYDPESKQTPEYGMETYNIASQKEVQNSPISGRSDVDTSFGGGIHKGQFCNTTKIRAQQ
jgi:hypothetical protein